MPLTELRHISLFSGVGMTELGMKLVLPINTILYCEKDEYCRKVLKARMTDGALDTAPIHDDVTTLNPADHGIAGGDIISGGFPCQDISCAGKGEGLKGARSGLFYEIMRIAGDLRPRYILLENVSALLVRGMDAVLGALSEARYDAVWTSVRASDVGAPHRRERVFILGLSQEQPQRSGLCTRSTLEIRQRRCGDESSQGRELAYAESRGATAEEQPRQISGVERNCLWPLGYGPAQYEWEPPRLTQPRLGRNAHGRAHRVDRLRALGNAIVPQQLAAALIELFGTIP